MKRHSQKKYPQIAMTKDTYDRLLNLKYDLRLDSINEVLKYLLDSQDNKSKKEK
jgi:hypothetical protein